MNQTHHMHFLKQHLREVLHGSQENSWPLVSTKERHVLPTKLAWVADDGVPANGGVRHVPPDVVDDVAIPLVRVAPPAAITTQQRQMLQMFWGCNIAITPEVKARRSFGSAGASSSNMEAAQSALHLPQNVVVAALEGLRKQP